MTEYDDSSSDDLMRLVGAELEKKDNNAAYQDEAFLSWLAADIQAIQSIAER